jgi:hypothetical protein
MSSEHVGEEIVLELPSLPVAVRIRREDESTLSIVCLPTRPNIAMEDLGAFAVRVVAAWYVKAADMLNKQQALYEELEEVHEALLEQYGRLVTGKSACALEAVPDEPTSPLELEAACEWCGCVKCACVPEAD